METLKGTVFRTKRNLHCLFTGIYSATLFVTQTLCVATIWELGKEADRMVQDVQFKSGPYFNMSNLFTKIYNMLYYTTNLYLQ